MSFLVGPVSGALVAGGIYYGFSNLIHTRTEQHRKDLHALSVRLVKTPSLIPAPPSAAAKIVNHRFTSQLQGRWNEEIGQLFAGIYQWERRVGDWGKKVLYGEEARSS